MPQQSPWAYMEQQAQAIAPRTEMDGPVSDDPMMSMGDIPQMTSEQAAAAIESGQLDPRQPVIQLVKSKQAQKRTETIKAPLSQNAQMQEMLDRAQSQAEDSYLAQKQGVKQMEQDITQAKQARGGGIDYTPFVSMSKFLSPDVDAQSMQAAAASLKPETPQQRAEKLIQLQNMLQGHKDASSKMAYANLAAALKAQAQNSELATQSKQSIIEKNLAIANAMGKRPEQFDRTIAERAHAQTLQSLRGNKNAQQKLQALQGIDNAGKIIEDAPEVTPQIFHDYQQALVAAIMRGNSGIAERSERYMKSAGIDAATIKQYLSGEPVDIGKNNALIKAAQGFAKSERGNIEKQYDQIVDSATSGQEHIYEKHPALKKDITIAVKSFKGMAEVDSGGPQIGDEVDGHIFKGGDPSKPENWEQK